MNASLAELLALDLDGSLLILTHDNPDPDSLASSFALQQLLRERRGIDSVVGYSGMVGRAENRAMMEQLGLQARRLETRDLDDFTRLALIDAQPFTGNSLVPEGRNPDVVIDHHPLRPATMRARFYDVRPDVGASATILTEYLRESATTIDGRLATALLYGIRTETHDLGRETSRADREAYHYLFPLADAGVLAAIANPPLSREHYANVALALSRVRQAGPVLIAQLEQVPDPDFIPEMADYLVRMEGMQWVLVYGYFGAKMHLSIRTSDTGANAGETMRAILGDHGVGGGHGMRAGGAITLQSSGPIRAELHSLIEQRFLTARGQQVEALKPVIEP